MFCTGVTKVCGSIVHEDLSTEAGILNEVIKTTDRPTTDDESKNTSATTASTRLAG